MGESRTELLQWLNDLLQINYTKIEQCGTGAAYCQIFDSIYGDLPVTRVKFDAKREYESLANFKVLQTFFERKKIDKPIPVDRLVKCKMQDNLEFLQWVKRYWDQNYAGQGYDAVARRKGQAGEPPATIAPVGAAAGRPNSGLRTGAGGSAAPRGKTPVGGARVTPSSAEITSLQHQLAELKEHITGLEKERDFYFAKLRDIEILSQQQLETLEAEGKDDETLREIQKILYTTEEGFEVPDPAAEEEETF
ncbi:Microtubule-associated protein RP/EB family member 1 [Serendipita indica DSM 11827]|nr:Microtubule-associated protein RP/EB family member 1 [Serendipita indica DSM 11827]